MIETGSIIMFIRLLYLLAQMGRYRTQKNTVYDLFQQFGKPTYLFTQMTIFAFRHENSEYGYNTSLPLTGTASEIKVTSNSVKYNIQIFSQTKWLKAL